MRKLNLPLQLLISLVIILILLSSYIFLSPYLELPIISFLSAPLKYCQGVSSVARSFLKFQDLVAENKRLNSEINRLDAQLSKLQEAWRENQRLRSYLSLSAQTLFKTCTAQLIGRDSSNWTKTIWIDKGSANGIAKGMPVISGEALVGRVIGVSPRVSKVALIVDFNSKVPAKILRTREQGVVFGSVEDGRNICKIKYIQDVQLKDKVITSGLGGIFPQGLLIGEVAAIEEEQNKLYKIAKVLAAVDAARLDEVSVITEQ